MVDGNDSQQVLSFITFGKYGSQWFTQLNVMNTHQQPNGDHTFIVLIMQTRKLKHRVTKQGAHNDTTCKRQSEDLNTDGLVPEPIMIHHYKYQNASRRGLRRNKTQLLPLSCSPSRNQEGLPTITVIFFPSVKADCKGHFRGEAPSLGINKYSLWEKNQNKYFNF